jgi:hypothetical protein
MFAQECETIDGQKVNCTDAAGLKQNYWKYRKKVLLYTANDVGTNNDQVSHYKFIILSEGQYKDSKKIGIWNYYRDFNNEQGQIEKNITYLENGNSIEENFLSKYKIETNSDSTLINGNALLDCDTVSIICKGNDCKFITSNGKEFLSFTRDKFEFEFFKLIQGMYNREIRIKKNAL